MKKICTIVVALFLSAIVFAQAPQKMSYQAVIRDASNNLVTSHSVGMKISILQGSATGTKVYEEIYNPNPSTNVNGLVSIQIGSGIATIGTFTNIDWSTGLYFIQTETDPTGGTNYTITGTSQLLSVPYALFAGKASNGFSGNYNDLANKPNLSDTTKFLKSETDPLFDVSVAKGIKSSDTSKWNSKSNFSGNYSDLNNKPTIPNSQVNSDWNATSGISQILNKPSLKVSFKGDTLYFGNNQFVIIPGISDANTPANVVYDINGNLYYTIKIGTQIWMTSNLNVTKYNDGTIIQNITNPNIWDTLTSGALCTYNNTINSDTINTYGRLYNWYSVNTGKLCPTDWHVPSEYEWTTLQSYLINNGYNYDGSTSGNKIAKSMASTTCWNTATSNSGAIGNNLSTNNKSGFNALPCGYRNYVSKFSGIGDFCGWWCSEFSNKYMDYGGFDSLNSNMGGKGFSVRCIKN